MQGRRIARKVRTDDGVCRRARPMGVFRPFLSFEGQGWAGQKLVFGGWRPAGIFVGESQSEVLWSLSCVSCLVLYFCFFLLVFFWLFCARNFNLNSKYWKASPERPVRIVGRGNAKPRSLPFGGPFPSPASFGHRAQKCRRERKILLGRQGRVRRGAQDGEGCGVHDAFPCLGQSGDAAAEGEAHTDRGGLELRLSSRGMGVSKDSAVTPDISCVSIRCRCGPSSRK